MTSGIYKITNTITKDFYIGQAKNFYKREYEHFRMLGKNKHYNIHFQRAYNKYGKENFEFKIILYCELFELTRYEQFFVNLLNPSYNIEKYCVTSRLGVFHSDEVKAKISEAGKGRHFSEESRQKKSKSMQGRKQTEEHRKKSADARRGKKLSEQSRRNVILGHEKRINKQPMLGKKQTEETKKKISLKTSGSSNPNFGKPMPKELQEKLIIIHTGKSLSEETKQKISNSLRGRIFSEESLKKMRKPRSERGKIKMSFGQKKRREKEKIEKQNLQNGERI